MTCVLSHQANGERAAHETQRGPDRPAREEKRERGDNKMSRRQKNTQGIRCRGRDSRGATFVRCGWRAESLQAIANLEAICQEYLKDGHRLEVIDVLEQPQRAMAEGVLVTPSLAKLSPLPAAHVIGNLSDKPRCCSHLD